MFRWLWQKLTGRSNRGIFAYDDGVRSRKGDPLAIWRGINTDPEFSMIKHPEMIDAGDIEAMDIGVRCVRRVFGVPEFAAGGLTEQGCLDLLVDFFDYTAALKKNISLAPISPPVTVPQSSAPSTMNFSAGSPSIENEANSVTHPA